MIKIILIFITLFFTACVNKHGISAKYYSDCNEYYDYQGYYHKECGEDDIITYKQIDEVYEEGKKRVKYLFTGEKEQPRGNVW